MQVSPPEVAAPEVQQPPQVSAAPPEGRRVSRALQQIPTALRFLGSKAALVIRPFSPFSFSSSSDDDTETEKEPQTIFELSNFKIVSALFVLLCVSESAQIMLYMYRVHVTLRRRSPEAKGDGGRAPSPATAATTTAAAADADADAASPFSIRARNNPQLFASRISLLDVPAAQCSGESLSSPARPAAAAAAATEDDASLLSSIHSPGNRETHAIAQVLPGNVNALASAAPSSSSSPQHLLASAEKGAGSGAEEAEEEGEGGDSGEDGDEAHHPITPQLMMQYWRQVERSILQSPKEAPPYPLPLATAATAGTLPLFLQKSRAKRDGARRPLERLRLLASDARQWSAGVLQWLSPRAWANRGGVGGKSSVKPEKRQTTDGAAQLQREEQQCTRCVRQGAALESDLGRALRLPLNGVFLYNETPDIFSFVVDHSSDDDDDGTHGAESCADETGDDGASEERSRGADDGEEGAQRSARSGKNTAPPHSAAAGGKETPMPFERFKWEALFLVWTRSVNFKLNNLKEVRKLLLNATPPLFFCNTARNCLGPLAENICSANLLLLWMLECVRRMYECFVIHGFSSLGRGAAETAPIMLESRRDNPLCEDVIEEVENHANLLSQKILARWPRPEEMGAVVDSVLGNSDVRLMCCPVTAWEVLLYLYRQLRGMQHYHYYYESIANSKHLLRYFFMASQQKQVSALVISALTVFQTQIFSLSRHLRDGLLNRLDVEHDKSGGGGGGGGGGVDAFCPVGVGVLVGMEVARLTLQYVLNDVTSEFLAFTAKKRKQEVKLELLYALSQMPLATMETEIGSSSAAGVGSNLAGFRTRAPHTSVGALNFTEEVEEILYYIDELEGVDVQLHHFAIDSLRTVWEVRETLKAVTGFPRALATALVVGLTPRAIGYAAKKVAAVYRRLLKAGMFPWITAHQRTLVGGAYDDDDDGANGGGEAGSDEDETLMFNGTEIAGYLPALRPYGADTRLMRESCRLQAQRLAGGGGVVGVPSSVAAVALSGGGAAAPYPPGIQGRSGDHIAERSGRPFMRSQVSISHNLHRSSRSHLALDQQRYDAHAEEELEALLLSHRRDRGAAAARAAGGQKGRFVVRLLQNIVGELRFAFVTLPYGKFLPAAGRGLADVLDLMLPAILKRYTFSFALADVARLKGRREALAIFDDAVDGVQRAFDLGEEVCDLVEMVFMNASKAKTLAQIVMPRRWENTSDAIRCVEKSSRQLAAAGESSAAAASSSSSLFFPSTAAARFLWAIMVAPVAGVLRGLRAFLVARLAPSVFLRPQLELFWQIQFESGCAPPPRQRASYSGGAARAPKAAGAVPHKGDGAARCPMTLVRGRNDLVQAWERLLEQHKSSSRAASAAGAAAAAAADSPLVSNGNSLGAARACVVAPSRFFASADCAVIDSLNVNVYRRFVLHSIVLRNVQFRYPQTPNRNAFREPLCLHLQLLDGAAGDDHSLGGGGECPNKGRIVAVTGGPRSGKTTLIHLLLALYEDYVQDAEAMRSPGGHPLASATLWPSTSTSSSGGGGGSGGGDGVLGQDSLPAEKEPRDLAPLVELVLAPRATIFGEAASSSVSRVSRVASRVRISQGGGAHGPGSPCAVVVTNLLSVPKDFLRGRIFRYVPQRPILLPGTLAHNVAMVNYVSFVSEAVLKKAQTCLDHVLSCYYNIPLDAPRASAALAASSSGAFFYASLPSGLATAVVGGDGGGGGGWRNAVPLTDEQVQLTMLARAYYSHGDVLLLDDPFQSLSEAGARRLMDMWRREVRSGLWSSILVCVTPSSNNSNNSSNGSGSTHDRVILEAVDEVVPINSSPASMPAPLPPAAAAVSAQS